MIFEERNGVLVCRRAGETLKIEGWGADSFRVRATMQQSFSGKEWALTEAAEKPACKITISGEGEEYKAEIENGRIKAVVNFMGVITFYRYHSVTLKSIESGFIRAKISRIMPLTMI